MQKLIITVALTGNVPTKEMNADLPVTAGEVAADVRRCADAGAVLFHVHARDAAGKPTLERDAFQERVRRIKEVAPEVIIQLSTGGRAGKDWDARATPVRLLPEMASFTTGSNNLPGMIYENSPQFIEFLAKVFKETGVKPEIEVFETGMINNALFLQGKGYLQAPLHFQFVLGAPGSMPASIRNLSFFGRQHSGRFHLDCGRHRQSGNPPGRRRHCHGRACARGSRRQSVYAGWFTGIKSQTG